MLNQLRKALYLRIASIVLPDCDADVSTICRSFLFFLLDKVRFSAHNSGESHTLAALLENGLGIVDYFHIRNSQRMLNLSIKLQRGYKKWSIPVKVTPFIAFSARLIFHRLRKKPLPTPRELHGIQAARLFCFTPLMCPIRGQPVVASTKLIRN